MKRHGIKRRENNNMLYEVLDFRVDPVKPLYQVLCPYCCFPNNVKSETTREGRSMKIETEHVCKSCKEYFQIEVKYSLDLTGVKYDFPF